MNGVPSISFDMNLTRYTNILSLLYDSKGESVTMKGHAGAVRSVDFSSDSKHLITASDDKTVKVHRPSLLHSINAVTYFYTNLHSLALSLSFLILFNSFCSIVRCGRCLLESSPHLLWVTVIGSEVLHLITVLN
jgi:WD40 repeat protein